MKHLRLTRSVASAAVVAVVGVALGFLARSERAGAPVLETASTDPADYAFTGMDGRYVPFETGEVLPFEPERIDPRPAPAPRPEADEWSRLSNHMVAAVMTSSRPAAPRVDMPAAAGFDASLDAVERSRLVAARSVEDEARRVGRTGHGFHVDMTNVCIPGIDE
jgi:hypothetical protein